MNVSYTITGLLRDTATGEVIVTMVPLDGTPGQVTVRLPSGSPAISALTIGRQVNATFTAV